MRLYILFSLYLCPTPIVSAIFLRKLLFSNSYYIFVHCIHIHVRFISYARDNAFNNFSFNQNLLRKYYVPIDLKFLVTSHETWDVTLRELWWTAQIRLSVIQWPNILGVTLNQGIDFVKNLENSVLEVPRFLVFIRYR